MGGIILVASIVIWALGHFPTGNGELTEAEQQEQSYMGRIGHAIEPAIRPLGYDWRMGVGIIAGVGAKELMVSTLGVCTTARPKTRNRKPPKTLRRPVWHKY